MATEQEFVQFIVDQISPDCEITFRKMFGEYGLYSHNKLVALVCDNQLFIKPTQAGRLYLSTPVEAPPYPGAKPSFLIEDGIDDGEWLSALVKITEAALPMPKPKKQRTKMKSKQA